MDKFGRRVRSWESLPDAKFCRNRLGYTPFGANLYQKIPILAISSPVGPHFKSHNREVWRELQTSDPLPVPNFVKNSLKGPAGNALPLGGDAYWFRVFFFLSRFGMTKFVITETLWSSIIFKKIMVSLHKGRFVVVHLCSSFPINPQNFSWGAIFTKNDHFWRFFGAVRPHF